MCHPSLHECIYICTYGCVSYLRELHWTRVRFPLLVSVLLVFLLLFLHSAPPHVRQGVGGGVGQGGREGDTLTESGEKGGKHQTTANNISLTLTPNICHIERKMVWSKERVGVRQCNYTLCFLSRVVVFFL